MFKYSYNTIVYYGEDIKTSIERLAKYNYDGIELVGEPDSYNTKNINSLCNEYGIKVSSICAIYNDKRDLVSPDPKIRKQAVEYVERIVDFASEVKTDVIILAPSACMKIESKSTREDEKKWAMESINKAGNYAKSLNIRLALEAWNRYETYFLNRLEQCVEIKNNLDIGNIGVMGDTFHMNIEEVSISEAIKMTGSDLIHFHLADSNRAAPGKGHIDFVPVLRALKDIDYQGFLTFELLPAAADPFKPLREGGSREFFDEYTKFSIEYIKKLEASLTCP